MNELQTKDIIKQYPILEFQDYETLLNEAKIIAKELDSMEVTRENVDEKKKLLAKVNKSISNLNSKRIEIKKEIMKPYDEFAEKIKTIEKVVKSADERLRQEVRKLDEEDREKKYLEIEKLWEVEITQSPYKKLLNMDMWYEEKFSNKSLSMNKIKSLLASWFDVVEKELDYITRLDGEKSSLGVKKYLETFDLASTLSYLEEVEKAKEHLKNISDDYVVEIVEDVEEQEWFSIQIEQKNFKKVIDFLNKENIAFEL